MKENLLAQYILTADIGGSHITAAICDISTNKIVPETYTRAELASNDSANAIFNIWSSVMQEALDKSNVQVSGVGLAMPGPFDYEAGISFIRGLNKYDALYGLDVRLELASILKIDPFLIRFRNDAEATIAGEAVAGAGKGYDRVMGVTLGTGFGSAYHENGVTRDLNLGCSSFLTSIADDHLSTRWFLKRYHELSNLTVSGVKDLALMAPDNAIAHNIFNEFGRNMAEFLAPAVNVLKPDILVICGNIAKASLLFLPIVKNKLTTDVRIADLYESATLIGAAELFHSQKAIDVSNK